MSAPVRPPEGGAVPSGSPVSRRAFLLRFGALASLGGLASGRAQADVPSADRVNRVAAERINWRPFLAASPRAIRATAPGRPLVIAFWSAHCEPCRHELPHWVAWQRHYPKARIVLVSTDQGEDRVAAERLLSATRATGLEHWAFADEFTERLHWSVDPSWRGELPRTEFYGPGAGAAQSEVKLGRLDPDLVEAWLRRYAK